MTAIKIIGIGGGGINILNQVIEHGLPEVGFIAMDFDWQSLVTSKAPTKIRLESTFRGLDDPGKELRQKDAFTQKYKIKQAISAADVVIVLAGLGGGTGSDVSPIVLDIAKENGARTAAIFNTPFSFEGARRKVAAKEAVKEICDRVNVLVVVSADTVLQGANCKIGVEGAFNFLDSKLSEALPKVLKLLEDAFSTGKD
jgi:cell division protein FtsZ